MICFIKKMLGIRSPSKEVLLAENEMSRAVAKHVNHPKYYNTGKIEVIDFIEDQNLGFCLGNAVKYIARAGKKNPFFEVEDLKKSRLVYSAPDPGVTTQGGGNR